MTTTEAIKQLQTEHDLIAGERDLDGSQFAPALLEAQAMAIEALSSSEIPNSSELVKESRNIVKDLVKDDTISRKAAIDEIEYELEMINSALDSITLDFNARERLRQRKGEAREILNSIQQLPSAQPERPKGHWICVGDGYTDYFKCSECGELSDYEGNFCCDCGSDNRGEQDGKIT